MRVYLIRHGETEYNRTMKVQGHAEIPLNDLGIAQAARLARRFTGVRLDRIYASDLRRATMTAAILAAHTGAPLLYDPGLRERDPGALTHRDYHESIRFFTDPTYEPPEGETHGDFIARVRRTFEALIEREVAREAWEQGSSGSPAAPARPSPSAPLIPAKPEGGAESDLSYLAELADETPAAGQSYPHPTSQFPAGGSVAPAGSAAKASGETALAPISVPAAPGIDLDAVPHLALVTHGMVCRAFVELFAPDAPPPGLRWLNTSVSILDYHPAQKRWHVHALADAEHLNGMQNPLGPTTSENGPPPKAAATGG